MNNEEAELYSQNNGAQRKHAEKTWRTLTEIVPTNDAEQFQHIIDFGCGTGEVTAQLPTWVSRLNATGYCFLNIISVSFPLSLKIHLNISLKNHFQVISRASCWHGYFRRYDQILHHPTPC